MAVVLKHNYSAMGQSFRASAAELRAKVEAQILQQKRTLVRRHVAQASVHLAWRAEEAEMHGHHQPKPPRVSNLIAPITLKPR